MDVKEHTVGAVAELAGVSVRTLHHYDEIGLLEPSERSSAGYRLYSPADLQRLQRILFYRELDFDLATIATMLTDVTDEDQLRPACRSTCTTRSSPTPTAPEYSPGSTAVVVVWLTFLSGTSATMGA